mmetsp:Transcript_2632/g.5052  ORF Transcript_2632/g.5052 Transcript_2632/m.5052 type:complete len:147 (+) Transcript_2632:371-811(+)
MTFLRDNVESIDGDEDEEARKEAALPSDSSDEEAQARRAKPRLLRERKLVDSSDEEQERAQEERGIGSSSQQLVTTSRSGGGAMPPGVKRIGDPATLESQMRSPMQAPFIRDSSKHFELALICFNAFLPHNAFFDGTLLKICNHFQ